MSSGERFYDPERLLLGTSHAIERARARGAESIEPDDLLAGLLLAVSRFGIVELGDRAVDLTEIGLRFDLPGPDVSVKPRYTPAAAAAFDRAARVARADGALRIAPIHLLVVLADSGAPTFARIEQRCGLDAAGWRRSLAALEPPSDRAAQAGRPATGDVTAPGPAVPDQLISPDDVARALGVHIQTVRGYIRSGKLPAFRVAGERAIRIRRDDLAALLENLPVPQPAADGRAPDGGAGEPAGRRPAASPLRPRKGDV